MASLLDTSRPGRLGQRLAGVGRNSLRVAAHALPVASLEVLVSPASARNRRVPARSASTTTVAGSSPMRKDDEALRAGRLRPTLGFPSAVLVTPTVLPGVARMAPSRAADAMRGT